MGGSRFPVLREPRAPSALHSCALPPPYTARAAFSLHPSSSSPAPGLFQRVELPPDCLELGGSAELEPPEAPWLAGGGEEGWRNIPCSWEGSKGCRSCPG